MKLEESVEEQLNHQCTSSAIVERAVGSILGQAVGDAIGLRYEYRSGEDVRNQITMDKDNNGFLPIRGSTIFDFPPGQLSDGSELCMVLARSLFRNSTLLPSDVYIKMKNWANSDPLNMDDSLYRILKKKPTDVLQEVEVVNTFNDVQSNTNKCLFLASPIAIAAVRSDGICSASNIIAKLIQLSPIAVDALQTVAAAISSLIKNGNVEKAIEVSYKTSRSMVIHEHLTQSRFHPHPQPELDCRPIREEMRINYIGIALQCAFHNLMNAKSFDDGIEAALQIGGDTTANAAITGALLGARFGIKNIPKPWRETVLTAVLDRHISFPDIYLGDIARIVDSLLLNVSLPNS